MKIRLDEKISFQYSKPSSEWIANLKKGVEPTLLSPTPDLVLEHSYFKAGLRGCKPEMLARHGVVELLTTVSKYLAQEFQARYAVVVFDTFRSTEAQVDLFNRFQIEIKRRNPSLNDEELWAEARRFVSHPDDKRKYSVSPHNTGGAVDLGIIERTSRGLLDFGTPFDDPSDQSATAYFEAEWVDGLEISQQRWFEVRKNRRILFHLMSAFGFTNYSNEWWHYEVGTQSWAKDLGETAIFGSMENLIEGSKLWQMDRSGVRR